MLHYSISYTLPQHHWLQIELTVSDIKTDKLELHLPAWRPGRYEFQNYAKNIRDVKASSNGQTLSVQKTSRNSWSVDSKGSATVTISYHYYCFQMDAGGSWLDEDQLYINPINCCFYVKEQMNLVHILDLNLPKDYKIATGLKQDGHQLTAHNYHELADSPLIASAALQVESYQVAGIPFYIWILGNTKPDWQKIIRDFKAFTQRQLDVMGEFPFTEYHFLLEILPYRHYHGVEHRNSTVITLGPDMNFNNQDFYDDLLGISSHELFHAWNICRIRPVEMMPYNFEKENYFITGFVAEGVTTYYGDLFLKEAGVYSEEQYLKEINAILKRHFENYGNEHLSLADSSFDLWVDGYQPTAPDRRVSIYDKGAVAALILDFEIRKSTKGKSDLGTLMRLLWQRFGKVNKGYSYEDYKALAEEVAGKNLTLYFEEAIFGTSNLYKLLQNTLEGSSYLLTEIANISQWEKHFGCRLSFSGKRLTVEKIAPNSSAEKQLALKDEIISINDVAVDETMLNISETRLSLKIKLVRNFREKEVELVFHQRNFFINYELVVSSE